MRYLLLFLSLVGCFADQGRAAERHDAPIAPGPFLPTPMPTWLLASIPAATLRVTRVVVDFPAATAGVMVGDRLVSIGGMHPVSQEEMRVVRLVAARQGNWATVWERDGKRMEAALVGVVGFGSIGIDAQADMVTAASLTDVLKDEVDRSLVVNQRFPERARLEARAWCQDHPGVEPLWLRALGADAQACEQGTPLASAADMPTDFLRRLDGMYRAMATASSGPHGFTDLQAFPETDDAWMAALYLPWPQSTRPEMGVISMRDERVTKALSALATNGKSGIEQRELANTLTKSLDWSNAVPTFYAQVQAAILDPARHAGWPYRSTLVAEAEPRRALRQELQTVMDGHGPDAELATLAMIGPAVLDGDWDGMANAIRRLHTTSPWLANQGLLIANNAAQRKIREFVDALAGQSLPTTTRALSLAMWLVRRGVASPIVVTNAIRGEKPTAIDAFQFWRAFHTEGDKWNRLVNRGERIANLLNNLSWWLGTDPIAADGEMAWSLARQMETCGGFAMAPFQIDTVAAGFARGGDYPAAVQWQRGAIRRLGANDDGQMAYQLHLNAFLANKPWTDPGLDPTRAKQETKPLGGGLKRTGNLIDEVAQGMWRTTTAEGHIVEELVYENNEPHGPWRTWNPQGQLQWSGLVNGGSRIGWWRLKVGADGVAEGWYDGESGGRKTGWWRICDGDGHIVSQGLCVDGAAAGTWEQRSADGSVRDIPALAVTLPADPPLPIGFNETFGADKF